MLSPKTKQKALVPKCMLSKMLLCDQCCYPKEKMSPPHHPLCVSVCVFLLPCIYLSDCDFLSTHLPPPKNLRHESVNHPPNPHHPQSAHHDPDPHPDTHQPRPASRVHHSGSLTNAFLHCVWFVAFLFFVGDTLEPLSLDKKKRHLRNELQRLRRKGALKTSGGSLDRPNIDLPVVGGSGTAESSSCVLMAAESCARCRVELGKIINRGAPCRACRLRVCKQCREFSTHTMDWVCCVCHKQM